MDLVKEYKKKTPKSSKLFEISKKYHVNGVQHNIRFFEPYPFVTSSSAGKNLIDVDSNQYVDYWMGHWSLILGHAPKAVEKKLQSQLKKGWMYGTVNEQTMKLSSIIQKSVPVAEKIRYVTSGTEATMYAVRLARAITGKKIVVKIDGGWHGYTSDLLKTVNWPFYQSESSGLVNEQHIISIPYNNLEKSLESLQKVKNDVACIIVEPVLGGGGAIPAEKDYLLGLQEFTQKNDALFLLDEIVTGFRFRFGCIYPTMKLNPDIVTLGKIVGGGLPIGVMCGKEEIMDYANTKKFEKNKRAYVGGGTFSANPLSMVSGAETLSVLKESKKIYTKINNFGNKIRKELGKVFDGRAVITGQGSLFLTHFLKNNVTKVNSAEDASKCDIELLHKYHFRMIVKNGVFLLPGKVGAISNAHSDEDVNNLISASEEFAQNITIKE